jgi:general transcription factor 3C protein 4
MCALTTWSWLRRTSDLARLGHLSVAFTAADGSIGLIRVVQSLQPQTAPAPLGSEYTPEISVECAQQTLVEADNRATTGIVWLSGSVSSFQTIIHPILMSVFQSILVYFKPGTVHFFTMNDTPPLWRSSRVLEIRQRQLAPSHLSSVSGIVHVPSRDALIFTLSDGSFHVAHNISAEPSWISRDYPMTSDRLLAVARGIFAQLEPGAHRVQEVNRISGMAAYDNSGIVTWTYE